MQNKTPRNENGKPHGFWDTEWNDDYRVCGNAVNGELLGVWIWYRKTNTYISNKTYYAR